ncbi:DUF1223 domain-containing protein [Methylophaga sp.]|uniref:DUF1223 domain-containing protein n=1 Tax=Methylophaga sp. TaxID=2024840 RepID=UPI003F696E54
MLKKSLYLSYLLVLLPMLAIAESWQAKSSDNQTAVIELFTAEGCGLCPAAHRWVKRLPEHGITDTNLIVLAFHIDYLDDKKAWVDKFAKPLFSDRQRQLARLNLYQTVFTPELFFSGEVVHNWEDLGIEAIEFINSLEPEADITLEADKMSQQLKLTADIDVKGDENRQHAKLYFAVTEDNIISEVRGGDNMGAIFNHQNLVRRWLGPFNLNHEGQTKVETELELSSDWKLHDLSIVAIVQNLNDGFTLQGISLPLAE